MDEHYTLLVGKVSRVRNHYRQVVIALQETANPRRLVNLVVRAYDEAFKTEALRLARESRSTRAAARQLGISEKLLKWSGRTCAKPCPKTW